MKDFEVHVWAAGGPIHDFDSVLGFDAAEAAEKAARLSLPPGTPYHFSALRFMGLAWETGTGVTP